MFLQSLPTNLGSPVFGVGGWLIKSCTLDWPSEGCLCDLGDCLRFSARLERWLILGLEVLRREGVSIGTAGSTILSLLSRGPGGNGKYLVVGFTN